MITRAFVPKKDASIPRQGKEAETTGKSGS